MPRLHKKTVSWADPKSTVHHRTPNSSAQIAVDNLNSNSGPSRRDARKLFQGPKSLFVQFFPSSTPKAHSTSTSPMKFKFSKSSAPHAPPKKIKSLPPTLYDDPAFSPDPHSHPNFVTSQGSTWMTPPAVGHPTLKSEARRLSPADASNAVRDLDEFQLRQPPNTPLSPTDPNDSQPAFPASLPSGSNSSGSLASTTPPSSMELSTNSPPDLPSHLSKPIKMAPTTPESQVLPPEKKRKTTSFLRRKLAPTSDPKFPSAPAPEPHKPEQHDEFSPSSDNPNTSILPEIHHLDDTPTPHPPPATTLVDTRTAHQGRSARALDRIDELDETNPLGLPMHHGGPYEAIRKLLPQAPPARAVPYNVGSQYQYRHDPLHAPHKERSHKPSRRVHPHPQDHSVPNFPSGMPLHLNPGQVLSRNFQLYDQRQLEPQRHAQHLQYKVGNNAYNPNHTSHHRPPPQPNHTPKHPSISTHFPDQYTQQHRHRQQSQPQQHIDSRIPYPQPSHINGHQQQQHISHQRPERRQSYPVDTSAAYGGIAEEQSPPHDLRSASAEKSHQGTTSSEWYQALSDPYIGTPHLDSRPVVDYAEKPRDQKNTQQQVPSGSGHHTPHVEAGQGNLGKVTEYPPELDPWHRQSMSQNFGAQVVHPETTQHHRPSKLDRRNKQQAHQEYQNAGHTPYQEPLNVDGEQQRPAEENQWAQKPANMQQAPQPYPPPYTPHRDQADGQQQRRPDRDSRSVQQSISGEATAGSFNTRNGLGGKPPQPNHIPKRLVMPTPLQQSPLLSPRSQSQLHLQPQLQPQAHFRSLSHPLPYQPQPRSPSPPLNLYSNLQSPRAKDIPMVSETQQGRKLLRKRASMNQGLPPSEAPMDPAVSFSAGPGYIEQPSRSKSEKKVKGVGKEGVPKRVLSKRRNDF